MGQVPRREQILSSLDRIGGHDNSISEIVNNASKEKGKPKRSKREKAQILAKSYEHLNALKARKLMLQRELSKFQDEIKAEN